MVWKALIERMISVSGTKRSCYNTDAKIHGSDSKFGCDFTRVTRIMCVVMAIYTTCAGNVKEYGC